MVGGGWERSRELVVVVVVVVWVVVVVVAGVVFVEAEGVTPDTDLRLVAEGTDGAGASTPKI